MSLEIVRFIGKLLKLLTRNPSKRYSWQRRFMNAKYHFTRKTTERVIVNAVYVKLLWFTEHILAILYLSESTFRVAIRRLEDSNYNF